MQQAGLAVYCTGEAQVHSKATSSQVMVLANYMTPIFSQATRTVTLSWYLPFYLSHLSPL